MITFKDLWADKMGFLAEHLGKRLQNCYGQNAWKTHSLKVFLYQLDPYLTLLMHLNSDIYKNIFQKLKDLFSLHSVLSLSASEQKCQLVPNTVIFCECIPIRNHQFIWQRQLVPVESTFKFPRKLLLYTVRQKLPQKPLM